MFDRAHDARVRAAAFEWLREQVAVHGDVLPRTLLPKGLTIDDASHIGLSVLTSDSPDAVHEDSDSGRRLYITAAVRQRLHQRAFRERVLSAYRHQCAFCRLRHEELLDAAHIVPDSEPQGEPL